MRPSSIANEADATPRRQETSYAHNPVLAARAANIRYRLGEERRCRDSGAPQPTSPDPADVELVRRLDRLDRDIAGILRLLARAGIVQADALGGIEFRDDEGSLLGRLDLLEQRDASPVGRADAA